MFSKAIINKDKNTQGIKGFVTNSGPAFPLAPSDLLLEVADLSPCLTFSLEDLNKKGRSQYNIKRGGNIEKYRTCLVHK